ncbi:solute carrier family 22 member 7-like [Corythoichthys intestinalis]|uniref:solute carrier family 22 member 7-like n=1 Tax=Corythoichthys intestinalis TaxID=161448 RepID=UPI0025A62980|nr:solute carrier family 22 member 7-like [Corythoichthys intestinalis]XP_061794441.1 solute carrier family 22 member 7-like [Nerophis lumbriciformis]
MSFDTILAEVGSFGPFQGVLVALAVIPRIVLPCNFLLNNFIAAVPSHRCRIGPWDSSADLGDETSCQILAANDSGETPTTGCRYGWIYDNSTFSSTIATEWDLVCDWKHLPQTTNTIFFLGLTLGSVVFGVLSDNYGRKWSLLISYVLSLTFGLASASAKSYVVFAVLRFLSGAALAGLSLISITLCVEWVDSSHRASMCIIGSLTWSLGNMLLGAFAFFINDWRPLVVAVTTPLAFGILTWWWVPESARWLLTNGDAEKAKFYLDRCARLNNRPKLSKVQMEALSDMETSDKDQKYTFLHLFQTPKLRKISLITGIAWYGTAVTYYGISLNLGGFGLNLYLTHFVYAAVEVPAKLLLSVLINRIGRRPCLVSTLVLTGTCIGLNILVPRDLWHVRSAVAVLGKGLSEASFTTIYLYTTELYPTVLRQNGMGFTSVMSRVGVSMAPLVLLLDNVWTLLPQILLCAGAVFCGLVALWLPETLHVRLPETVGDVERARCGKGEEDVPLKTSVTT